VHARLVAWHQSATPRHTLVTPSAANAAAAFPCCCLLSAVCCRQSAAHLNIAHTNLTNLAGLSGLQVINGDLIAWDNANLLNLQGLGPVTQLYGKLWMDSNPRLQDMTGLEVGSGWWGHCLHAAERLGCGAGPGLRLGC
jgi:hypothetical protein